MSSCKEEAPRQLGIPWPDIIRSDEDSSAGGLGWHSGSVQVGDTEPSVNMKNNCVVILAPPRQRTSYQ